MIIRDATEADLPAIVEIFNATIPSRMVSAQVDPVSVEERLPWFRAHSADHHPLWVMSDEKQVIAWLSLQSFLPRCAYAGTAEVSVYVREDFRRRGVTKSLLGEAIVRAPTLGRNHRALLGTSSHAEPSLRFFARAGFGRWGCSRGSRGWTASSATSSLSGVTLAQLRDQADPPREPLTAAFRMAARRLRSVCAAPVG